jgi:hypothetical protein
MIADDGTAFLVWHTLESFPKDGGKKLLECYEHWKSEKKESHLQYTNPS